MSRDVIIVTSLIATLHSKPLFALVPLALRARIQELGVVGLLVEPALTFSSKRLMYIKLLAQLQKNSAMGLNVNHDRKYQGSQLGH